MTRALRRPRHWLPSLTLLAAACLLTSQGVLASAPPAIEAELLSGARLWASKNRPDMARQLVDKLLAIDPYSPQGLGALADLALREKKTDEAKRILETLRTRHPENSVTQELETLVRIYGPDREKLSQMRLMARAGRKAEAAELARKLFPQGPPELGGLALEYHQIIGSSPKSGTESMRQLGKLYQDTGESRYRMAQLEMRMYQGANPTTVVQEIEALAKQPDINAQQLQDLWRRALDRLTNTPASIPRVRAFLQRYPADQAAMDRLAAMQQAVERAERVARDPANIARNAARTALDQGNIELAEDKLQAVLALRPSDGDSLGNLGLIRLRQGRHAQAQDLFGQAFTLTRQGKWKDLQSTARFWGFLRQADMALDKNELATAADLAGRALAMQPRSAEALTTLASIRDLQGDRTQAEALYQNALKAEANNSSAYKGLAGLYARTGRSDEALTLLAKAAATDAALGEKLVGTQADILLAQADEHMQAQRLSTAMRTLESAVLLTPDDAWLRHRLARLYLRLNLPREALSVMDEGIARMTVASFPAADRSAMRYARALIRSAADDDQGALADLAQVAAADQTDSMRALVQRSTVQSLLAQGAANRSPAEAQALLDRAEQAAGNDAELLYSVANTWFRRAQPKRGVAVFDRLAARSPGLPLEAQLDHAQLLGRAQDDAGLAARLPSLLQSPGWNEEQEARLVALYASHRERLVEQQRQAGNLAEAVRLARQPLPLPATPTTAQQRAQTQARLLMAAGEYADAAQLLAPLAKTSPKRLEVRMGLADALSRVGDVRGAAEQALWLQDHLPATDAGQALALLRIWQRIGRMDEARALSARLLQDFPQDSDVLLHAARLSRANRNYVQALGFFRSALTLEGHSAVSASAKPQQGELADTEPPLVLLQSYALSLPVDTAVVAKIQGEIDAIEARRQVWIEAGHQALRKSATEGISSLRGWERPMVAFMPRGYDGHYFLHVDRVQLDAGELPANGPDILGFGQVAAQPTGLPLAYRRQRGTGTNLGFGFAGDNFQWDVGTTGVGLPVTNLVGGLAKTGDLGRYGYKLEGFRRPVTGSLLSYAGAADPITGQIWGGVVATGASGRLSTDIGPYSSSVSLNLAALTGKNVQSNTRAQLRVAVDRDVWRSTTSVVNMGVTFSAWHYGKDLSEYSFGHGGYYSPRSYASVALPVEWSGRRGPLTWLARGSISVSRSSSADTDYFPQSALLQSLARARLAESGSVPVYAGSSGSGFGRSFRGVLEYQATRNLALGAQLELDRSAYYAPTNFMVYGRYRFDPVLAPLENRPRPVQTYSSF
ncbi:Tfp pilus assembly protein PilF [Acidovorax sp. 69]|uniref:cellulose synthase subunit BcsC-related outer membrane protein n=1 Tax=Acidovorax sp. 69 TaxID=2035202 RepID=UPI000C240946|nr:cellulose synthase subunit BcsC-related outer membrane protein [Acidovorax sp. 69]PJI96699.1 Tfp pilus assembly protein PilF [Acidovorax sp. 69]